MATNAANFTKGDVVGVVLDADQGEIVFFRNGIEQGRARGIRGRLYPFVSCDSEADQVYLLGSYSLLMSRVPRQIADMEWDTMNHARDLELSSNCLTASKTSSSLPSTVRGTILYAGTGGDKRGGTRSRLLSKLPTGPQGPGEGAGAQMVAAPQHTQSHALLPSSGAMGRTEPPLSCTASPDAYCLP